MKKLLALILSICLVSSLTTTVFAAGVSTSTRSLSVVKGSSASFTITASNAAGRIDISSSNSGVARINKSNAWLDKSSTSVTVTGVSNGSATVYVKITDVSTYGGQHLSGTIAVNINVYTPVYVKSNVSTLSNISIADVQLEQQFNPSVKEYTAYLPNDMQKPNISVSTSHSLAKVSSFDNNLHEGWNDVKITCTAEDGKTTSSYVLKLYVEETPDEIKEYKGVSLGVVKNLDKVNLEGFEKTEGQFVKPGYNLEYMMNMETREKGFYLVDGDQKNIIGHYNPIAVGQAQYVPFDASYQDYTLNHLLVEGNEQIAGDEIACWNYSEETLEDYCVVELLNEVGEKELFTYDKKMGTFQRYYELPRDTSMDIYKTTTYGLAGLSALLLVLLVVIKRPKKN